TTTVWWPPGPLGWRAGSGTSDLSVEGPRDDVKLLLTGEPHEVHRVAGDPDGELRVLLRVLHGLVEGVAVEDVDVHVEALGAHVGVEEADEVAHLLVLGAPPAGGDHGVGQRDAV